MSDEEIIEALYCCSKYKPCDKCPMYKECLFFYDIDYIGVPDILILSLDLIKRQKAKINQMGHCKNS